MNRPAEKAGSFGSLATAIALAAGASAEVVGIVGIASGLIPGVVTWIVTNGGLRGALRRLWIGKR